MSKQVTAKNILYFELRRTHAHTHTHTHTHREREGEREREDISANLRTIITSIKLAKTMG